MNILPKIQKTTYRGLLVSYFLLTQVTNASGEAWLLVLKALARYTMLCS